MFFILKEKAGYEIVKVADAERPVTYALTIVIVLAGLALAVTLRLALAEERRPRLAVMRALGLSRTGLVTASVLEGAIYAVAAALIGALPGIAAGWLIVSSAGTHVPEIQEKHATILFSVSVEAIAASIAAGALITVVTLVVASIRTTRMTIASAVRALPDPPNPRLPSGVRSAGLAAVGVASVAALVSGAANLQPVGGVGAILAIGLALRGRLPDRVRATIVGAGAAPNLSRALRSKVDRQLAITRREYPGPVRASWTVSGEPVDWHQQLLPLYELTDSQLTGAIPALAERETRFSSDADVFAALRTDPTLVISGAYRSGTTLSLVGRDGPVHLTVAGSYKTGFLPGVIGSSLSLAPLSAASPGTTLLLGLKPAGDPAAFPLGVRRFFFPV